MPANHHRGRAVMAARTYDIITVGGGIAGSALAKAMAEQGARVLVLEHETTFRDRVRGEAIMPWGTAEARELGILDIIMAEAGHELPWFDTYQGLRTPSHRDLAATTDPKTVVTAFYHPQMQESLIAAAADAGAEIRRGTKVIGVQTNGAPEVVAELDGRETVIKARLLVGADGRHSTVRSCVGFDVQRDRGHNLVAGVLFDGVLVPDDACHAWLNSQLGLWVLFFPQGRERVRAYVCYPASTGYRLTGVKDIPRFIEDAVRAGVPEEHYANAKAAGPLATFEGTAGWVHHPYRNGVALLGEAAATPDPTWGQGLSLSLKDARVLRDQLLSHDNWDEAGDAYAGEHDQYYGVIHTMELWQTQLLLETGPDADARRQKTFAAWQEDRTRGLDVLMSGPGPTLDEADPDRPWMKRCTDGFLVRIEGWLRREAPSTVSK